MIVKVSRYKFYSELYSNCIIKYYDKNLRNRTTIIQRHKVVGKFNLNDIKNHFLV